MVQDQYYCEAVSFCYTGQGIVDYEYLQLRNCSSCRTSLLLGPKCLCQLALSGTTILQMVQCSNEAHVKKLF